MSMDISSGFIWKVRYTFIYKDVGNCQKSRAMRQSHAGLVSRPSQPFSNCLASTFLPQFGKKDFVNSVMRDHVARCSFVDFQPEGAAANFLKGVANAEFIVTHGFGVVQA